MATDWNTVMQRVSSHQSRHRFSSRLGAACFLLVALVGSLTARDAEQASANAGDEASFVASLNAVRAGVGLPALTTNTQLTNLSRGHAQVMADAGEIFHADPISAGFTGAWSKLGENVGVGANVSVLVDAFVASPGHYANIIDPAFTQVGVGVVWKDGALYTTHRFLQVSGATTTTTLPPPTTTPPATTTAPPVPTTTIGSQPAPTTPPPTAPPTTSPTTTLPPLTPPSISAARVVTLFEMLELVGT